MVKKIISIFILLSICFSSLLNVHAIELSASASVLMNVSTGEVLCEKNAYEKLSMASTTKIMTALICSEYIEKYGDISVDITQDMVSVEGSSMGLVTGDKIELSGLLVGMMLPSGNDAANSVALFIGETQEGFAAIMNGKAKEIGMDKTNFVTPSGLDDEKHYTCAYDMALLTQYALKNETFANVFSQKYMTVKYYSALKSQTITVGYTNHNKLLESYEYCTGGKTGYTKKSGRCLVTVANKNDCELVAVTLNAPDDWNDHIALMEYGFSLIKEKVFESCEIKIPTAEGDIFDVMIFEEKFNYINNEKFERTIFLPKFIYGNSIKKGEKIGKIKYYMNEELILETQIIY